jgi:cyclase
MHEVLDMAALSPKEVILVIITHADGDHIGGNSLFDCPILAHQMTSDRMAAANRPQNEMPTETFSGKEIKLKIGGVNLNLIHKGGHKPDLTMLWLPEEKILLPSDLVFEGRYPYMVGSDVPTWISALRSLSSFEAEVIFPGHGTLCGQEVIDSLIEYMDTSWKITAAHIVKGITLAEVLEDPQLPRPAGWIREQLFETNIRTIYEQIIRR